MYTKNFKPRSNEYKPLKLITFGGTLLFSAACLNGNVFPCDQEVLVCFSGFAVELFSNGELFHGMYRFTFCVSVYCVHAFP